LAQWFAGDQCHDDCAQIIKRTKPAPGNTEKRNILGRSEATFGEEYIIIDAVAIMTDTDNAHGKVTAITATFTSSKKLNNYARTLPYLETDRFFGHQQKCTGNIAVNLGYLCNLSCTHCHVNAGPKRTELMDKDTVDWVLDFVKRENIHTLDLTGGAS